LGVNGKSPANDMMMMVDTFENLEEEKGHKNNKNLV
jgi:hypothetical protein